MSAIYYIETPQTWQDRLRAFAADLTCTLMAKLDYFGRWEIR